MWANLILWPEGRRDCSGNEIGAILISIASIVVVLLHLQKLYSSAVSSFIPTLTAYDSPPSSVVVAVSVVVSILLVAGNNSIHDS